LLGCAHARTAAELAMMQRGDCAELLKAADAARAGGGGGLAGDLANACPAEKLAALVDRSEPAEALLWCGRARAALPEKGCDPKRVSELAAKLNPRLTLGPPDPAAPPDPLLGYALDQLGKDLNLGWDAENPDVIVGKLSVTVDHTVNGVLATVTDAKGRKQRVPAVQHRFVARAEGQVELAGKTRTLRASEEERDMTWDAAPKLAVPARFEPQVPATDELNKRAALAWLRALAKALAAAPPENIDVADVKGCVAYGLSLNLNSGDAGAAASGAGDPAKIAACEKLLGEPAGAGIPVP
jgi:hypothetical protein